MAERIVVALGSSGSALYDGSGNLVDDFTSSDVDLVAPNPANQDAWYGANTSRYVCYPARRYGSQAQPPSTVKDIAVSEDYLYLLHGLDVTRYSHSSFPTADWTVDISGDLDQAECIAAFEGGFAVGGFAVRYGMGSPLLRKHWHIRLEPIRRR